MFKHHPSLHPSLHTKVKSMKQIHKILKEKKTSKQFKQLFHDNKLSAAINQKQQTSNKIVSKSKKIQIDLKSHYQVASTVVRHVKPCNQIQMDIKYLKKITRPISFELYFVGIRKGNDTIVSSMINLRHLKDLL